MRAIHTKFIKVVSGILFSGFLISLPVYAEEISRNVDLIAEIEPTLQVVVPTSISLNLTPNLDGSPVFVSKDLNILVATNNPTGYHLSLQTNSTNLTNNVKDKDRNYPILETIDQAYSETDFLVNRCGYKYNTENYIPFTTSINLSQTTTPTNQDNITLTFAAKADITKPAGTYSLALNFAAVANMIPGVETIIFNGNGATSGEMPNQQIEAGTSQNLNQNQFARTDYVFLNWNTSPDGTGTTYAENELYSTTLTTENKSLTLYAQWGLSMQDYTLAKCEQEATNNPVTVYDERDKNDYTVRYINGNCWQTQNLRIASGTKLTPDDSNVATNYVIPSDSLLGNIYTYTVDLVQDSGNAVLGYWYNFCATTAKTVCVTTHKVDSVYDICPKGWRLPSNDEFNTIINSVDAFSPILGGNYYNGKLVDIDTRGNWWSSTQMFTSADVWYEWGNLYYDGSAIRVGGTNRRNGEWVLCILKN